MGKPLKVFLPDIVPLTPLLTHKGTASLTAGTAARKFTSPNRYACLDCGLEAQENQGDQEDREDREDREDQEDSLRVRGSTEFPPYLAQYEY